MNPEKNPFSLRSKLLSEDKEYETEFRIRLPESMADKIAELAKRESRSRNKQYVHMLKTYLETVEGISKI